ncbi:MAG: peptidase M16, partial [Nitrospinaceae bacterium]|nr:peptidase M16 [Nitrospinaceae bacterium]NIR53839.1 peptidase M16 [Nitrospinaceae bacterium]NIS84250.1 peptidase M16 [Nitrospinaceae bacterium]NIT81054.1 peptidase M16 [Nitrospinaceae bacterium]NIU43345.1 peptidase M16 [Nitrospinaceae bacterium]
MEHSVLCGSRKYPVKEPFLELMKGSLQTFLNAMTFPDKTMFPVASRNQKDFFNLMNVYLDAVFYPRITEETFMQEGWHHDLESKDKDIQYKGVVYNEMKGVFSSPENLVDRYLSHLMFPGTAYGYESGGDPKAIPDLTYEEFREFHRKYYHPSNSRFFFYGNGDTREYLEFLDKEYLKDFQRQDVETRLSVQRRFRKPKRKVLSYPVSKEESLDKKTFVLTGMKLDKATNHEHCLAFDILSHLLLGTSASPLRKALMDSELGSEVIGGGFDDHRLETVFAVGLKGTEAEHEAKILDLIFNTLQDLVEGGIDENLVTSAVNTIDFKLREANFGGFAKGIVYNIQALGSWLYGKDPFMHLRYDRVMKKIKERAKDRYFESLIERYLLNNPHRCVLVAVPKPGLGKRQETRLRKKLKDLKSTLSPEDLEQLVSRTRKLQEIQRTPDRPEDLDTLPRLDLKDISRESEKFPLDVKNETGPTQLFHDLFCNNIAYLQIGFNTDKVPLEKIQYLPLLGRLLVGMGTRTHDYVEISKLLGIHTGGIRPYHFT